MDKKHLSAIFKVLADENRLRIVNLLRVRKMCVCELAFVLGVTQPSVSRHLKKMKAARIIGSEKAGFWTDYFLIDDDPRACTLLKCLKGWLREDRVMKKDLVKFRQADRRKLCCSIEK